MAEIAEAGSVISSVRSAMFIATPSPDALVLAGISNMTYCIAFALAFRQYRYAPNALFYAAYNPILDHTFQHRKNCSGGYRPTIYVTVLSGRARQGHLDGRTGTAQRPNRRASFTPATDCQQMAQTILRGTPPRFGKPSSLRAPAQFFPLN